MSAVGSDNLEMEQVAPGVEAGDLVAVRFYTSSDAAIIIDTAGTLVLSSPSVTTLFV